MSEAAPILTGNYGTDAKPFLPNSAYQQNLNKLLLLLSSAADSTGNNISSSGGFSNATAGKYQPGQAFGIFLCRGDIDAVTCSNCIDTAAQHIGQWCPSKRTSIITSIIWYDICMLKYTNRPIYAVMRKVPRLMKVSGWNVTDNRSWFRQLLGETLDDVVRMAPSSRSGKKVAVVVAELTGSQRLYMLAECTPDLTTSDCSTCLRLAVTALPRGMPGGRVLTPSCDVRFEEYPFYNAAALVTAATAGLASFCSCSCSGN